MISAAGCLKLQISNHSGALNIQKLCLQIKVPGFAVTAYLIKDGDGKVIHLIGEKKNAPFKDNVFQVFHLFTFLKKGRGIRHFLSKPQRNVETSVSSSFFAAIPQSSCEMKLGIASSHIVERACRTLGRDASDLKESNSFWQFPIYVIVPPILLIFKKDEIINSKK